MGMIMGWVILTAALAAAVVSDLRTRTVCDLCWWCGLASCAWMLGIRVAEYGLLSVDWFGTGLFLLIQELVMSRSYGRADCHGFCICALALAALGMGLREDTGMMLVSFLLLVTVQILKRNIRRDLKLRIPVAFVPYIAAGFAGTMLFAG